MRVSGQERRPDWPKLGPSILIATALIVAIRTAKWAAKSDGDPLLSDTDVELDREISFAARISIRVMHELLRRHEDLFPQKSIPIYEPTDEDARGDSVSVVGIFGLRALVSCELVLPL